MLVFPARIRFPTPRPRTPRGAGASSTLAGVNEQRDDHSDDGHADRQPTKGAPPTPSFLKDPAPMDKFLFFALMAMGVFSLAMLGLRAWFLSHPLPYSFLIGGYTSATVSGANVSVDNGTWWVYLAASLVGALKFVPIYWLMGKRWGMEFIDMSLQYMPRAHRFFRKAVKKKASTTKAITLGLLPLGFAPGPVPGLVLNAIAGLLKVRFRLVLLLNVLSVLAVNGLFMWLGYTFGDQVLEVVNVVNQYLLWFTLGLIAFAIFSARRKGGPAPR